MSKILSQHRLALRALNRLSRAYRTLSSGMERALKEAELPGMAAHDVLSELAIATGQQLRPGEIGAVLGMAQYNLSRLLDRLEALGMVRRGAVAGDARGQWVALTPPGAAAHQRMATIVANLAHQQLFAGLEEDQIRKLSKLLRRIVPQPAEPDIGAH